MNKKTKGDHPWLEEPDPEHVASHNNNSKHQQQQQNHLKEGNKKTKGDHPWLEEPDPEQVAEEGSATLDLVVPIQDSPKKISISNNNKN